MSAPSLVDCAGSAAAFEADGLAAQDSGGLAQILYLQEPGTYAPISINDINQDSLGDCFLLAAVGELALNRPDAIQNMIHVNSDGTETVTLYQSVWGGVPTIYETAFTSAQFTVDNIFPSDSVNSGGNQDVSGGQKETWVQVIENAVAQAYGGYGVITNGGYPLQVMEELTGQATQLMPPSSFTLSALQGFIAGGDLLVFDTPTSSGPLPYDLVGDHAYMFEGLIATGSQAEVQLGNPWGNSEPLLVPVSQVPGIFDEIDIGQSQAASQAPPAPIDLGISAPGGDAGGVASISAPTISGIALDGSAVVLSDADGVLGGATADQYGTWSITLPGLRDGAYDLSATATSTAGQVSSASGAFALTIKATSLSAPTGLALAAASDSGIKGDGITKQTEPTLTGKADAGSTVVLTDAEGTLGTAVTDQSGTWSITPSTPVGDGTYSLTAHETDSLGNVSALSQPFKLTIDSAAPLAPSALTLAAASDSFIAGDGITNTKTIEVTGQAEAGSTVTLFDEAGSIGSALANQSGVWSITTAALADGTYSLDAQAVDVAGNVSASHSAALLVTIDTTPPAPPADLALAASAVAHSTDDTTPTITGRGEADATLLLYDGARQIGSCVVAANSTWSVSTDSLGLGGHTITATETDLAGNTSNASSALAITITAPPPASNVTLPGGGQAYVAVAGQAIQAGSGSDTISAAAGEVTVTGSAGALTFFGGSAASSVNGGIGPATLFGGVGGGTFVAGAAGHSILVSEGAAGVLTRLYAASAGDQIFGSAAGNDVLSGGAGRDSILGGDGQTTINGGDAASVIFTGAGPTTLNAGAAGEDTIVGGVGALAVTAQQGDAIFGGGGALTVDASLHGADSIVGGSGALGVSGRGGNMLVVAGTGTSDVSTGNGASLVFAGSGNLSLVGGAGSMQIVAGSGHASISEGAGPTTLEVVRGAAGGTDVITGFRPGADTIALFGYQPSQQTISATGASTVISLADGTKITLLGTSDGGHSIIG